MTVLITLILAAGFLVGATVVHDQWQHTLRVRRWRADRCLCARFGLPNITARHFAGIVHERTRCFPVQEFIKPREENV